MGGFLSRLRARFRRSKAVTAVETSQAWDAVTERARADMEARQLALIPLSGVVGRVSAALFGADPVGLGSDDEDEYDSEAETIVLRLADRRTVASVDRVQEIVHEEFVRWFGEDLAGEPDRYEKVAPEVHRLWGEFLADE